MQRGGLPTGSQPGSQEERAFLLTTKLLPSTPKQNCLLTSQLKASSSRKPSLISQSEPNTCSGPPPASPHPRPCPLGNAPLCGDSSISTANYDPQEGRARTVMATAVSPALPAPAPGTQEALEEGFAKHGISGARLPVSAPSVYCFFFFSILFI